MSKPSKQRAFGVNLLPKKGTYAKKRLSRVKWHIYTNHFRYTMLGITIVLFVAASGVLWLLFPAAIIWAVTFWATSDFNLTLDRHLNRLKRRK
jgi:E3 ubiquitin-protein ligase DOA10